LFIFSFLDFRLLPHRYSYSDNNACACQPWLQSAVSEKSKKDYDNSRLRWRLWTHLGNQIWTKEMSYRENIIRGSDLQGCATEYFKNPWWHNDYLDWVFLDSLVAFELVTYFDVVAHRRFGIAYGFVGGKYGKQTFSSPPLIR
jgi:hypothetical protein